MKKIIALLFFMLPVSWAYPQTVYLNVNLKNGGRVTYTIQDIHKIDFSNVVTSRDAQKLTQIIQSLKLLQNYPNPFNPSTIIEYEIPMAGEVEIAIYDITGRLIKTIENNNRSAGCYQVKWEGLNESGARVASGLYLYSVKYQNTISTKKMILIR